MSVYLPSLQLQTSQKAIRLLLRLGLFSQWVVNPFYATDLFRYPLKTSKNQRFCDVFRGYRKRSVAWNELHMKLNALKMWREGIVIS